jgi:hypothetical protein
MLKKNTTITFEITYSSTCFQFSYSHHIISNPALPSIRILFLFGFETVAGIKEMRQCIIFPEIIIGGIFGRGIFSNRCSQHLSLADTICGFSVEYNRPDNRYFGETTSQKRYGNDRHHSIGSWFDNYLG